VPCESVRWRIADAFTEIRRPRQRVPGVELALSDLLELLVVSRLAHHGDAEERHRDAHENNDAAGGMDEAAEELPAHERRNECAECRGQAQRHCRSERNAQVMHRETEREATETP